jgi:hypothetical protein
MELGFLSPLLERPGPWASVYTASGPASEDAATRQELQARAACERLEAQGADRETSLAVQEALTALPRDASPPGHALFATAGKVVLQTPLTTAPAGSGPDTCWEPLPRIGPLPELAEPLPVCLLVRIDRTGAAFELRGTRGETDAGTVDGRDWPVHRTSSADWSERHFQNAVEDTWEQNAATVAQAVADRQQESGAGLIVLIGEERMRRAVHDRLPVQLAEITVEAQHGVRETSRAEAAGEHLLDEEIERARHAHGRRRLAAVMDRFRAGRVPGDDGTLESAEGVPALVEAAREHRIGTLLLRPEGADLHREVWVGDGPDQVAVRRTESQYLGEPRPAPARADDALLRSAVATDAEVLCVRQSELEPGTPDGLPVGGIGALLRWPYGGAPEGGGVGGGQHTAGQ